MPARLSRPHALRRSGRWSQLAFGRAWLTLLVLIGAAGIGACSSDSPSVAARASASASAASRKSAAAAPDARDVKSSPALDLASVRERAHFAFRADKKTGRPAFESSAYRADIDADGAVRFGVGGDRYSLVTESKRANVHLQVDGSLSIERDEAVEHLRNVAGGLEQSWSYLRAPAGDASLVVRVRTGGLRFDKRTSGGLHFRGDGERRFRYGAATWVDANGAKSEVVERVEGDAIVLEVPRALLATSAYPAELDPTVGPEVDVDQPVTSEADATEYAPQVVAGPSDFLVVWSDTRANLGAYGARVDPATGHVRPADLGGVQLFEGGQTFGYFGLGWNGATTQVLVWGEEPDGAGVDLRALLIDATTGRPLAGQPANGHAIAHIDYIFADFVVGWDGREFVLGFLAENLATAAVSARFVRIDATTGAPNAADGASGAAFTTSTLNQYNLQGDCGPTDCLFSWIEQQPDNTYKHYLTHLSAATGTTSEPAGVYYGCCANYAHPIAWDPINLRYVLLYGTSTAYLVPPGSGTFTQSKVVYPMGLPTVTNGAYLDFDGTNMVVSWVSGSGPYALRVDRFDPTTLVPGDATGAGVVTLHPTYSPPSGPTSVAAHDGTTLLVTGIGPLGIAGARWSSATRVLNPADGAGVSYSVSANAELDPAIVASKDGALVAWSDTRQNQGAQIGTDVYAARIDRTTGQVVAADAAGIDLTTDHASTVSSVATDGTDFFVAWQQVSGTVDDPTANVSYRGAIVHGSDGSTTPPVTYESGTDDSLTFEGSAAAFDGQSYIFTWGTGALLKVGLVDPKTAGLQSTPLSLAAFSPTEYVTKDPWLTVGSSNMLLTWTSYESVKDLFNKHSSIRSTVLTRAGSTLTAAVPAGTIANATPQEKEHARGAFGGSEYLVAWEDYRNDPVYPDVYGQRFAVDGSSLGSELVISKAPARQAGIAVTDADDGLNFQVVWSDERGTDADIYGSLVGHDGTVRQPAGAVISGEPGDELGPTITTVGAGQMLLAYSRFDATIPLVTPRLRSRVLSTGTVSGACGSDADCATLHCKDGVCCDQACDGACQSCGATPGKCTSVASAIDPDTCKGESICSRSGTCVAVAGEPCAEASDCASGFCADSVCCESACSGGCDVCNVTPGTCTVVMAGNSGANPTCLPDACDGVSHECPGACTTDAECIRPYTCSSSGACKLLTGASCVDDHTVRSPSGAVSDCAPYACTGSSCETKCSSIRDCSAGSVCDGARCIAPAAADLAGGGCDLTSSDARGGSGGNGVSSFFPWLALTALCRRKRREARAR